VGVCVDVTLGKRILIGHRGVRGHTKSTSSILLFIPKVDKGGGCCLHARLFGNSSRKLVMERAITDVVFVCSLDKVPAGYTAVRSLAH